MCLLFDVWLWFGVGCSLASIKLHDPGRIQIHNQMVVGTKYQLREELAATVSCQAKVENTPAVRPKKHEKQEIKMTIFINRIKMMTRVQNSGDVDYSSR